MKGKVAHSEHPVLDYQRAGDCAGSPAQARPVHVLSLLASAEFLLPFLVPSLQRAAYGSGAEWRGLWLLVPAGVLWLAGALTASCGIIVGLLIVTRSRPRFSSVLALAACGAIVLVSLAHVLRGFRQTFQYGP